MIPFRDEVNGGTIKRTIWPKGDAIAKQKQIEREVGTATSKRGKRYSCEDQRKIAAERYGEFCESRPQWEGRNER